MRERRDATAARGAFLLGESLGHVLVLPCSLGLKVTALRGQDPALQFNSRIPPSSDQASACRSGAPLGRLRLRAREIAPAAQPAPKAQTDLWSQETGRMPRMTAPLAD